MAHVISDTGTKRKFYYAQFSVALTPIERMFVQFYADRYGKDQVAIVRGMLRKFVQCDDNFDPEVFIKWAEKMAIPAENNREMRALLKEQLRDYADSQKTTRVAKSSAESATRRKKVRAQAA